MNIYEFENYRTLLKSVLKARKRDSGKDYSYEKMASACRIQRTYLSAALSGRSHLNSDQIYSAAEYLGLNDGEYQFLADLHDYERSVNQKRKSKLLSKIKKTRVKQSQSEHHIKVSSVPADYRFNEYCLDPYAQIIHMFLTIDKYGQKLDKIKSTLSISTETMQNSIQKIEDAGFIKKSNGKYVVNESTAHLPASSPYQSSFRNQTRLISLNRLMQCESSNKYSISAVFSSNEKAPRFIHQEFLKFLNRAQEESQRYSSEEVYQMNFDLFSWTKD